ncbi:MAG: hypothetical protein J6S04_02830, partial [Clostridia bacterium]|nr:hypothetical protein [Clostridia bacterium]
MTFTTDCQFIENELLDVVRLFKRRPETLSHSFQYEEGVFCNTFVVDGKEYFFKDEGQVRNELEFTRYERRFSKLRLYHILSELYGEEMPWGALTGIRPTKLAYTEIEQGRDFKDIFRLMKV